MTSYYVVWRIDVDAISQEDAARQAREMQRDPLSTAGVFDVTRADGGDEITIDLDDLDARIAEAASQALEV